jgi:hypothetical protein
LIEGNVLAGLEAEVGVDLAPVEFASRAQSVTLPAARSALAQVGAETPPVIADKAALDAALRATPKMTQEQIAQFLRILRF